MHFNIQFCFLSFRWHTQCSGSKLDPLVQQLTRSTWQRKKPPSQWSVCKQRKATQWSGKGVWGAHTRQGLIIVCHLFGALSDIDPAASLMPPGERNALGLLLCLPVWECTKWSCTLCVRACVRERSVQAEWARESHCAQRQWRVENSWGHLVKGHLARGDSETEMMTCGGFSSTR